MANQPFDLRINGKPVKIKNGRLVRTMDTPADMFTAQIIVNRDTEPELYEAIKPYRYSPVEIYIDGALKLTGILTKTTPDKSTSGVVYSLEGYSNTFNFIDSAIIPPYEFTNQTLHDIATVIAGQTNTAVEFNVEPGGIFARSTATPGQTGDKFLAPLARQRNQIMSSTPEGKLSFGQANTSGVPVGTIKEDDPASLLQQKFSVSFDGRQRFKNYKVKSSTPFGFSEAIATDDNINQPRQTLVDANENTAGEVQATAEWQKNLALIEALTIPIPVVGWKAPNGTTWEENTLITLESEAMFVPNGFTFLIKQVEYIYDGKGKNAVLSLIPPNVYTNEPIVEPWF